MQSRNAPRVNQVNAVTKVLILKAPRRVVAPLHECNGLPCSKARCTLQFSHSVAATLFFAPPNSRCTERDSLWLTRR